MARIYTIDASVFLNAFNPFEAGHEESHHLLSKLRNEAVPIVVPSLLLPEVAAAIARGCDDANLARQFAAAVSSLPLVTLIELDTILAEQAADLAADCRLRGSDAVYAAVALRFGSTLVTLDREQRERLAALMPTRYPTEALTD